jgi:hypothetical protein
MRLVHSQLCLIEHRVTRDCNNGTLQETWNFQLQGKIYFKLDLAILEP